MASLNDLDSQSANDAEADNISEVQSDSSSIVYGHEPFETFRGRVLDLATSLIWPKLDRNEVVVERMQGGGFNRVIGITQNTSEDNESDDTDSAINNKLILRVPRFDAARVDHEVAILQHLAREKDGSNQANIPVPEVVCFDETKENPLESPYMIQKRIPGTTLLSAYPALEFEDQLRVAKELGSIIRRMLTIQNSVPGIPALATGSKRKCKPGELPNIPIHVEPFATVNNDNITDKPAPYASGTSTVSTYKIMSDMFYAHRMECMRRDPKGTVMPKLMDRFDRMASQLHDRGHLTSTHFSVAHLDLAPRNILVNNSNVSSTDDGPSNIISGILDWDSAIVGPQFMACSPPMWIWAWKDDEDEDERLANEQPRTEHGRQLKACFENALGQEYISLAYAREFRLARRLFHFAMDGVRSNEDFTEAEDMLDEWETITVA